MHGGRTEYIEELEEKYEMAVKSGRGGLLSKDLKVLQRSQRPKTNSVLKADNGQVWWE